MDDHTYAQAYADWQAELREAARRPGRGDRHRPGVRGWLRGILRRS